MSNQEVRCSKCFSNDFYEDDGLTFCRVCDEKLEGFIAEKTDEEHILGVRLKGTTKTGRKTVKELDTGINWTTYEAFNLLLVEHLRILTNECGQPDLLRKVVLTIWAMFLEKTQVAFVDGNSKDPKLPSKCRRRDVAVLSRRERKIPRPCNRVKRRLAAIPIREGNVKNKRVRYGRFVVVNGEVKEEREVDENVRTHSNSQDGSQVTQRLNIEFDNSSVSSASDDSDWDTDDEITVEGEPMPNEEYCYFDRKVPFSQLNNFSKRLTKYVPNERKQYLDTKSFPGMVSQADYMDMSKLISMIYLGIRILDIDIQPSVLLRWIDEGVLPFNQGCNSLPEEWVCLTTDVNSFGMHKCAITVKNLLITASLLHRNLDLPSLAEEDMTKVVQDQIYHLNLPSELFDLMSTDSRFIDYLMKASEPRKQDTFLIRSELSSFAALIVLLRKLFILDGKSETKYSERIDENELYFNWKNWESHTRLKLFMITNHIIPTFRQDFEDFNDSAAMNSFYEMTMEYWRKRNIAHVKSDAWLEDKTFCGLREVVKSMVEGDFFGVSSKNSSKNLNIEPSKHFLIQSTDRLISKPVSKLVSLKLREDYRNKSVKYFECGSEFVHNYKNLVVSSEHRSKNGKLRRSPPIDLLFALGMVTFRLEPEELQKEVGHVERIIFGKHGHMVKSVIDE